MIRVLLVLGVAAALSTPAAGNPAAPRPALRVLDLAPLTVKGVRFQPGERVNVAAFADGRRRVRLALASAAGSFVVSYPSVALERCNAGLEIKAVGSLGSRAALKLPQLLCPPPLGPP